MKIILVIPKAHFENDERLFYIMDELLQHTGGMTIVGARGVWRGLHGGRVEEPVVAVHASYDYDHEHDAKTIVNKAIQRLHELGEQEVYVEWVTRQGSHCHDSVKQGEVWYV